MGRRGTYITPGITNPFSFVQIQATRVKVSRVYERPSSKSKGHRRWSSKMYLHGCPWTSFKYLFPKCTCIDAIRQVPISKMHLDGCPWTFFVKYLFPKMARLSTDVLRQVPICRIRSHGGHLSRTGFQNAPALTPFVKYLFPKCACINTICKVFISKMCLHGRQCCPRTSFVKYLLTEFTCMAVHGPPS